MKKKLLPVVAIFVSLYVTLLALNGFLALVDAMRAKAAQSVPKLVLPNECAVQELPRPHFYDEFGTGLFLDSSAGWRLKNTSGSVNHKGYLGACYSYAKDNSTYRVVLIGDSFTGATQVSYDKTFAYLLEKELSQKYPAKKVQVINLGIGGYGLDQEYFTLINEAAKYKPDLVIHNIFLGNDFRDISSVLNASVS